MKYHLDSWVLACDNSKIEITTKDALQAIETHRQQPQKTQLEATRQQFSKDTFLDTLVEFIVADDQVSLYLIVYLFTDFSTVLKCC
jgi:hypothetical protein